MSAASPAARGAMLVWTGLVVAFVFAPILSLVVFSFNADRFPSLPWGGFSLRWYEAVLADGAVRAGLANSLVAAAASAAIATPLGFAAAYVTYRFRFPGRGLYVGLASLPPTVPVVILGVAMLTFEGRVGLSGSLWGVIAGHVVVGAPFAMALIRMRLADLDPDVEPAAWNLGAGPWRTLWQVVLPFARPAVVASLLITASISFDEYMIAWFVSGFSETLPVRVLTMLQGQVSPRINAIGAIVFAVSMLLVVLAQAVMARR